MDYHLPTYMYTGNVVWEDAESAYRALYGVTNQPVALRSEFTEDQPMEVTGSTDESAVDIESADQSKWRMGVECPRAKRLLVRYAVGGDQKVTGAGKWSNYYRKYGNPNWKRKTRQVQGGSGGKDGAENTWREKATSENTWKEKPVSVKTGENEPAVQDLRCVILVDQMLCG